MAEFYHFFQTVDVNQPGSAQIINDEYFTSGTHTPRVLIPYPSYLPEVMTRSRYAEGGNISDALMKITFANTSLFAQRRLVRRFEKRYWVEIAERPNALFGPTIFWRGVCRDVSARDNTIIMSFMSAIAALDKYGLTWSFGTSCRFNLYDPLTCKASNSGRSHRGKILAVDGAKNEVLVDTGIHNALAGVNFIAGKLLYFPGPLTYDYEEYYISSVRDERFFTLNRSEGLAPEQSVTLIEGCDKRLQTCSRLFSNTSNFGGFPEMPISTVWGQDITKYDPDV